MFLLISDNMADISLRPHHALGYIAHEIAEAEEGGILYIPDAEYIGLFRKAKGNFHSGGIILHFRKVLRQLHEDPDQEFEYVEGIDSVCEKCEHNAECSEPSHEGYRIVKQEDEVAANVLAELEFGKPCTGGYLKTFASRVKEHIKHSQNKTE